MHNALVCVSEELISSDILYTHKASPGSSPRMQTHVHHEDWLNCARYNFEEHSTRVRSANITNIILYTNHKKMFKNTSLLYIYKHFEHLVNFIHEQ